MGINGNDRTKGENEIEALANELGIVDEDIEFGKNGGNGPVVISTGSFQSAEADHDRKIRLGQLNRDGKPIVKF